MIPYKILTFFNYDHLPSHLQEVSRPFCELAWAVAMQTPQNSETAWALRKLLEAKDAAVRAVAYEASEVNTTDSV